MEVAASGGIFNERGGAVLGAVDQLHAVVTVLGVDAEIASSVDASCFTALLYCR